MLGGCVVCVFVVRVGVGRGMAAHQHHEGHLDGPGLEQIRRRVPPVDRYVIHVRGLRRAPGACRPAGRAVQVLRTRARVSSAVAAWSKRLGVTAEAGGGGREEREEHHVLAEHGLCDGADGIVRHHVEHRLRELLAAAGAVRRVPGVLDVDRDHVVRHRARVAREVRRVRLPERRG